MVVARLTAAACKVEPWLGQSKELACSNLSMLDRHSTAQHSVQAASVCLGNSRADIVRIEDA